MFWSTTRKLDLPPHTKNDSRRLNKVNHSIPCPNTRLANACLEESLKHDENVVIHTTDVLESKCSEQESWWHIYGLPYPSKNNIRRQQANT